MVLYKKNKKWKSLHVSIDMNNVELLESQVEEAVKTKLIKTHLSRQWKAIDIMDIQIISATYQPTKNTTFVDVLVFVVDRTGEELYEDD